MNGAALGVMSTGFLFLWAGIKGVSVPGAIQDILHGNAPTASANQFNTSDSTPAVSSSSSSGAGSPSAAQAYAFSQFSKYGWGADQQQPLINLWNQESGWNANAVNPSSGAMGIPQALGHGHVFNLGDYKAQVDWGLAYIKGRYGSPSAAWQHEQANNWY